MSFTYTPDRNKKVSVLPFVAVRISAMIFALFHSVGEAGVILLN